MRQLAPSTPCCTSCGVVYAGSDDFLQQVDECTIFSSKPQLLHMIGEGEDVNKIKQKPHHQLSDTVFQLYCPAFKLGRCSETMQGSWVSNGTVTRQKPSLAQIICSLDSGSWSFKDKIQTAHDSAVEASGCCTALHCPAQEPALLSTLCFNCPRPFTLNEMFCS